MNILYRSKINYLWVIATFLAIIATPFITKNEVNSLYIITALVVIYFVGHFSLKEVIFYKDKVVVYFPSRIFFRKRVLRYNKISNVEIKKIKGSYQRPYVILNFKKGYNKSLFFSHRSFMYDRVSDLSDLLKYLDKIGVKIISRMSKEHHTEKLEIDEILNRKE